MSAADGLRDIGDNAAAILRTSSQLSAGLAGAATPPAPVDPNKIIVTRPGGRQTTSSEHVASRRHSPVKGER